MPRTLHWSVLALAGAAAFCGQLPAPAAAQGIVLDSREFKLMLKPQRFAGAQAAAAVDQLWREELQQLIARTLPAVGQGQPPYKGHFELHEDRQVIFRDSAGCMLDASGFILRER